MKISQKIQKLIKRKQKKEYRKLLKEKRRIYKYILKKYINLGTEKFIIYIFKLKIDYKKIIKIFEILKDEKNINYRTTTIDNIECIEVNIQPEFVPKKRHKGCVFWHKFGDCITRLFKKLFINKTN